MLLKDKIAAEVNAMIDRLEPALTDHTLVTLVLGRPHGDELGYNAVRKVADVTDAALFNEAVKRVYGMPVGGRLYEYERELFLIALKVITAEQLAVLTVSQKYVEPER